MYRIFIIIGILILIFTFSGKAQDHFFPEIKINPNQTTLLPNINGNLLYEGDCEKEIKTLKNEIYLLQAQNSLHEIKKISENYCLNYRRYKKYRKCMLIFNK